MTKTIGVLTSGGDCAGLNTVLKAVTQRATGLGWKVIGIKNSTMGLLEKPYKYINLTPEHFGPEIARLGGTILGTTIHGDPTNFPMEDGTFKDRSDEIIAACKELGIEALIVVGGDGSLKILYNIFSKGNIPIIGIPKTIDNDLGATERSIGFSTAVDVATEALDRLQPTAASHARVMILEVMGRDAGHIALHAGVAGGADLIIIPEIPYSFDHVVRKIKKLSDHGRNFALVVVAEAVKTEDGTPLHIIDPRTGRSRFGGIGHYFADRISELTGAESRFMVLGHVQRGAAPSASDRVLAYSFGVKAVDLLAQGQHSKVVAWQNRRVIDVPILDAIAAPHIVSPDDPLIQTARGLGICMGDK